jgi:hypothetical protein
LLPQEGQARSLARATSSRKESFGIQTHSSVRLKIVHEFGEQRLDGFHQIIPASLKPK